MRKNQQAISWLLTKANFYLSLPMVWLCYFLCLQLDVDANASATLNYTYPLANLFFATPGFVNPAISRGLCGFSMNPAGLASAEQSEFMITFSSPLKTEMMTEFSIPFDTSKSPIDTVKIPTYFGVKQVGGLDYLGLLFKVKSWRIGIGFQRGDYLGLDFDARVNGTAQFTVEFDTVLTHDLIEEIPIGDSIPAHITIRGNGNALVLGEGAGSFQYNSLVFAAATRFAGVDFGFGAQITPVAIRGNLSTTFSGDMNAASEVTLDSTGDWTINALFDGQLNVDSIIGAQAQSDMSFYLTSFYFGLKKEWRDFSLGLCGELSTPAFLSGDWSFDMSFPSVPMIRFDNESLYVDTVNKTITGYGDLIVYDYGVTDTLAQGVINSRFLSTFGMTAGVDLHPGRFEIGLFGGGSSSVDGNFLRIRAGANLGFRTFIPLRLGVIFQSYYLNALDSMTLPAISFGGGTDFNIRNLSIFLNVSGNSTQTMAAFQMPDMINAERQRNAIISIGVGLRYRFW